ncbi:MAG: hypothetical protein WKG07_10130 [Hymenobacter sp.]
MTGPLLAGSTDRQRRAAQLQAVSVEEFIPDRLKVTVTAAPAVLRPAQTVMATILAQNLFGPPAAGRKFEVEFSLKGRSFHPKNYPDYTFDLNTGERPQTHQLRRQARRPPASRRASRRRCGRAKPTPPGAAPPPTSYPMPATWARWRA